MKAVRFDNWLLERIRSLPKEQREAIGWAIRQAQQCFGQVHLHQVIGIRKISRAHYELRAGLDLRLILTHQPTELKFVFMGNHDEVRRFLKGER